MRVTVAAFCLLLCLELAHARLQAVPAGAKKCNDPCLKAWKTLNPGRTYPSTRSQGQDKGNGKGPDNKDKDNKGQDDKPMSLIAAAQKFCAGNSCAGCFDYDRVKAESCGKQPADPARAS
jgi:hypothetical protein